jgi:hypothetical protein
VRVFRERKPEGELLRLNDAQAFKDRVPKIRAHGRRTFSSTMSGPAFSLLVAATIVPIVSGTFLAWVRFR